MHVLTRCDTGTRGWHALAEEPGVPGHISNILTKLEVVDRTQAVLKAREAGLGR